jgi:hypothetical protein
MSKYYSIREFAKILGVSAQMLRNWDKKDKRANKVKKLVHEMIKGDNMQ